MRKIFIVLLVLVANITFAQTNKTFVDVSYITVEGKSKFNVEPDEIYLKIVINENHDKKISLNKLEKSMFRVLRELKVDINDNLICKDYSTNLKKHFFKSSDVKQKKEYELKLTNPTITSKVILALKNIKIPNVSVDKLRSTKYDAYKRKALIAAIENAKQKANEMVKTLGVTLGKPLFIAETSLNVDNPYSKKMSSYSRYNMDYSVSEVMVVETPVLNFENIEIESKVEIVFKIED